MGSSDGSIRGAARSPSSTRRAARVHMGSRPAPTETSTTRLLRAAMSAASTARPAARPSSSHPPQARAARRVWCDSKSRVWVSEWNSGELARYDGNSWKEWKLPGDRAMAYAVYVDDADVVWVTEWGGNSLVRFDPATETFVVRSHPSPNANVRQLLGRHGEVWGAMSGQDKLVVARPAG